MNAKESLQQLCQSIDDYESARVLLRYSRGKKQKNARITHALSRWQTVLTMREQIRKAL